MSDAPHAGGEAETKYGLSLSGGPLYRLLLRTRLSGSALELQRRRIIAVIAIAWLPLLLLTLLDGHAWSGVAVPFLADVGAQARLLVSLPLLIGAERVVDRQMRSTLPLFVDRGLFKGAQREQFADVIASAQRRLDSPLVELALVAIVVAATIATVAALNVAQPSTPNAPQLPIDAWHGTVREGHRVLTPAGWWAALVSLPLVQFLAVRWYFRLLLWWRFLWQVARIQPRLQPFHPDRMGGLSFLSRLTRSFAPLLLAQGTMASGVIANQILYGGATLTDFNIEIVAIVVVMAIAVGGPLCFFAPDLSRFKKAGLIKHEALSMRYAEKFDQKWMDQDTPDEPLLGNPDPQTFADLGSVYESVHHAPGAAGQIDPDPADCGGTAADVAAAADHILPEGTDHAGGFGAPVTRSLSPHPWRLC